MKHTHELLGSGLCTLVLLSALASCGPAAPPQTGTPETALPTHEPRIIGINHLKSSREPLEDLEISQRNCDGVATVSTTATTALALNHVIDAGATFTVSADGKLSIPEIGSIGLGAQVAARYGVSYGSTITTSQSIALSALPGTDMLHTLHQYEIWDELTVDIETPLEPMTIPFRFRKTVGFDLAQSFDRGCPTRAPTPFPGAGSALHTGEPAVPLCSADRPLDPTQTPCWFVLTEGIQWEELGYDAYQLDVGVAATLIRSHNRDRDGNYLFPYYGQTYAIYLPSPAKSGVRLYEVCAPDRARRQYPCVYEVSKDDNSYRDIAQAIYGDPTRRDAILEANQYYDATKGLWYKVELKEGVLLVMPRFP